MQQRHNFQKYHLYHSMCSQLVQAGVRLHMGQFSTTISAVAGSVISDNQHLWPCCFERFFALLLPWDTVAVGDISGRLNPPRHAIC